MKSMSFKNSNNIIKLFVLLLWVIFFLTSCVPSPARDDWEMVLPNNYVMVRTGSNSISIWLKEKSFYIMETNEGMQIGIPKHIICFKISEQYVCTKNISSEDYNSFREREEVFIEYYILNTKEQEVYGPYLEEEFWKKVKELELSLTEEDWISTRNLPEEYISR